MADEAPSSKYSQGFGESGNQAKGIISAAQHSRDFETRSNVWIPAAGGLGSGDSSAELTMTEFLNSPLNLEHTSQYVEYSMNRRSQPPQGLVPYEPDRTNAISFPSFSQLGLQHDPQAQPLNLPPAPIIPSQSRALSASSTQYGQNALYPATQGWQPVAQPQTLPQTLNPYGPAQGIPLSYSQTPGGRTPGGHPGHEIRGHPIHVQRALNPQARRSWHDNSRSSPQTQRRPQQRITTTGTRRGIIDTQQQVSTMGPPPLAAQTPPQAYTASGSLMRPQAHHASSTFSRASSIHPNPPGYTNPANATGTRPRTHPYSTSLDLAVNTNPHQSPGAINFEAEFRDTALKLIYRPDVSPSSDEDSSEE